MTESQAIAKLKDQCERLAKSDAIPMRGEVFGLLGMLVEIQHNEIQSLQARLAKVERQLAGDGVEQAS
jgi:hypothetical protein